MKATPLPYQIESIREIDHFRGRALVAHEMGLGKTLIALWWWMKHDTASPAIVVCPANVKYMWEHECLVNLGIRPWVLEGQTPSQNGRMMKSRPRIVIVNYDILQHWMKWIERLNPQCLIVDECQYCKNMGTLRSKAVRSLAKGKPYVLALSGTPLTNRVIELFPTLQMIKPKVFTSRYSFAHSYCKPKWTPWGWKYDGATNLDQLHEQLVKHCMVRYLKKDVLKELPPKTRRVLSVGMEGGEEYKEATDNFLRWMAVSNPAKLLTAMKAETLVKLGYLKRLAARLKLRSVVNWSNEWLEAYPDEKLVLFAWHRKMIEALRRRIDAKSVVIDGSVTGRRRKALVDQFQQDRKTRMCIGNIRAAGIGITLTAASTLAFAELSWVPTDHTQAEDRIHRIGQKSKAWIWYLIAGGTIEEDLCEVLEEKQKIILATLDDGSNPDDLDVYSQLIRRLKLKLE